jgi:uncharacterized protein (DUF2384 family)
MAYKKLRSGSKSTRLRQFSEPKANAVFQKRPRPSRTTHPEIEVLEAPSRHPMSAPHFAKFIDQDGVVVIDQVAKEFGVSKAQFAETAGLSLETFYRASRSTSSKTQTRLKELLEIVGRIVDWAGSEGQAMAWYRSQPLPEFGGRTAESLVKDGKATAVRDYLDHVALGGFA